MVNPLKVGFVFALCFALFHALWAALVALGVAQKLLDFIFWIHFITPPYAIEAFDPARAGILVGVTGLIGMLGGVMGGALWNLFHRVREV